MELNVGTKIDAKFDEVKAWGCRGKLMEFLMKVWGKLIEFGSMF
jgi:hypothetical protein